MTERQFFGVCAWLADRLDIRVGGLRLLFVIATIFGFGSPIILYLLLYLVKPKQY